MEDGVPAPVEYTSSMALNSSQINMCAEFGLNPAIIRQLFSVQINIIIYNNKLGFCADFHTIFSELIQRPESSSEMWL